MKKFFAFAMALVMTMSVMLSCMSVSAFAVSQSEIDALKSQKSQLSSQKSSLQSTINSLQSQQSDQIALKNALDNISMTPDVLLDDVNEAIVCLGSVTGKGVAEQIIEDIFSRFCVGK